MTRGNRGNDCEPPSIDDLTGIDGQSYCTYVAILNERLTNVIRIQNEQLTTSRLMLKKLEQVTTFQNRLIGYSVSVSVVISLLWDYGTKYLKGI